MPCLAAAPCALDGAGVGPFGSKHALNFWNRASCWSHIWLANRSLLSNARAASIFLIYNGALPARFIAAGPAFVIVTLCLSAASVFHLACLMRFARLDGALSWDGRAAESRRQPKFSSLTELSSFSLLCSSRAFWAEFLILRCA